MIASTLILFFSIQTLPGTGETAIAPRFAQVRPGTFKSGDTPDLAARAEYERLEADRLLARNLLGQRDAATALRVLLPWRDKLEQPSASRLYDYFFKAYVMLGDWRSATKIAQEQYDARCESTTNEPEYPFVVRLATGLYVLGQKQSAWNLCQQHAEQFNASFYENYLPEFTNKQITRGDLGFALLRASAKMEDNLLAQDIYALLVRERPSDAEAHYLLAQSLPHTDLLGRLYHFRKAKEFGDAEMQGKAGKQADIITHDMKMSERQRERRGGGSIAFSIGG